jgi:hypothetical protein
MSVDKGINLYSLWRISCFAENILDAAVCDWIIIISTYELEQMINLSINDN